MYDDELMMLPRVQITRMIKESFVDINDVFDVVVVVVVVVDDNRRYLGSGTR